MGKVSSRHQPCLQVVLLLLHWMACFGPLYRATERRRLVVNPGRAHYSSCWWAAFCVCDTPALTVAPSVLEDSAGSASWLLRGSIGAAEVSLGPGHMPLPHCRGWWGWRFGELSGCLLRANNALSVGDCVTVNNVRIAWKIPFRSTPPQCSGWAISSFSRPRTPSWMGSVFGWFG